MWRGLRLVVVLSMCLQLAGLAVGPSFAYAADGAEPIAQGIASFGQKLDEMGFLDALGEPIPLTAVSPSDDQALRLYRLFGDSLADGLAGFGGNLDDLVQKLVTDLSKSYEGVDLSFTEVTPVTAGSVTDFSFTVTASRADSLPVAYLHEWVEEPRPGVTNTVSLDLSGGGLTPTLQLSSQLHFRYDSGGDPAFYLAEAPAFDLTVAAGGPIQPFEELFGFAEIEVSDQNLALNDRITIDLVDPDDDGKITPEEWIYTAAADLFAVQRPDAGQPGQGLSVTLLLEAAPLPGGGGDLLPGTPDGYVELADNDLTDGLGPPVALELGELARLDNVQADDVLAGLASLASGLIAAQGRADAQLPNGRLPYLGNSFSDAFSVAEPLGRFIQQQGDAAILCGTVDSDPPSGEAWRVAAGTTVYCQAITVSDAEMVAWTIDPAAGSILANGTMTTTVGPNPTANAAFAVTVDGSLPISVTFTLPTDPAGRSHTVTPRFRSAQELFGKLSAFPGFSLGAGDVAYDPSTTALTYHFGAAYDPEAVEGSFDFSDQLQPDTGLAGLKATDAASITLDAGTVALDLAFGTILVDNYDDITPDTPASGLGDRFFVQVDDERHEVEMPAIAFPATIVDLVGRVGFVEVSAEGNRPFEILPSPSGPMLAIDFVAPPGGIPVDGHGAIADAILIPELVSDTLTTISPEIHIGVSAGLSVTAEVEDATGDATVALGQGTVTITWMDVAQIAPAIETSDDLVETLQVYDIQPSLFGTATVTSIEPVTHTLTDTLATFTPDLVGRELRNLTDNSRCLITAVVDAHTLACAAGLQSGALNVWQDGDRYEVTGNPTALRDVILDNLYSLAYRTDTVTPTQVISDALYFSSLPLLGQSPYVLATQFDAFKEGIDEVRAGVPDATITCGVTNTVPPSGTLSSLVLDPIDLSDWAYCQAKTATDVAVSGVKWTMTGGEYAGASASDEVTATVGISPTANAEFVVTEPAGVQVSVTFTDTQGTHTATYPPRPLPQSLQDLERALESKLGLPPSGLVVEPLSLVHPTGPETRHLVVRLGQGVCTTGHADCEPGDRVVRKPNLELKVDLGADLPALMGLERTETAQLAYASRAQLDLAFPLSHTLSISDVAVLETSGLSMTLDVSTASLDMEANVGPLSLAAGLGAALTGTHHLKTVTGSYSATISSTDTLTNTEIWFVRDWGVVAGTTTTITNTTKDKDCQVEAVTEHTITCLGALSDGAFWEDGDGFVLVGPSTKVLYHPGPEANFTQALVDKELTNTDDGSSCTIEAVLDADTLRCAAALAGGADNTWEDDDGYSAGAVGRIEFGARFQLAKDGITPGGAIDTFSIDDFVSGLRASLDRPAATRDCGDGLAGDACARISLRDLNAGEYLGELRLSIADISSPEVRDLTVPQALRDQVQNAAIDFDHLAMGLEALRGSLVVALDGNESDLALPLIGTTLDAGADIATVLRDGVMAPLGGLGATLNALLPNTPATTIESEIQNYLSDAIPDLLLDGVDVAVLCNAGGACGAGEFVYDISDVRLSFTIGNHLTPQKGCEGDSCPGDPVDLPFDVGLPGVSLFSDDLVASSFGWRLDLSFGLSRTLGAYVDVGDAGDRADLEVGARVVMMKDAACDTSIDPDRPAACGHARRCGVGRWYAPQRSLLPEHAGLHRPDARRGGRPGRGAGCQPGGRHGGQHEPGRGCQRRPALPERFWICWRRTGRLSDGVGHLPPELGWRRSRRRRRTHRRAQVQPPLPGSGHLCRYVPGAHGGPGSGYYQAAAARRRHGDHAPACDLGSQQDGRRRPRHAVYDDERDLGQQSGVGRAGHQFHPVCQQPAGIGVALPPGRWKQP
jgi:hypothetical protein